MHTSRRLAIVAALSAMLMLFAAPGLASAQDRTQQGLVNVAIGDVTVQLPIALAANICDVNVNVLAQQLRTGDVECDADAASGAVLPGVGRDGATDQRGLVNVLVGDVTIQVPVAVAANVCDVSVNVLARQLRTGDAACEAVADSDADIGENG